MNPTWQILVEALRDELQAYGGLLRLFTLQQENLLRRDADGVLAIAGEIETFVVSTAEFRRRREELVTASAVAAGRAPTTSLRSLLDLFPEEVRPLLSALITEINHLIHRGRRHADQNRQLLARAVDMHRIAVRLARGAQTGDTYSPSGAVRSSLTVHALEVAG